MKKPLPTRMARAIRAFFGDHLPRVRGMSAHTIHSYRDSLVLLLRFVAFCRRRDPAVLDFDDISSDEVLAFLDHLEETRRNSASTRNVRLAAIHAFFRYVAAQHPDRLSSASGFLVFRSSVAAPGRSSTWSWRRSRRSCPRSIAPRQLAVATTP